MNAQYPSMRRAVRTLSLAFPSAGKEALEEQAYLVSVQRRTIQEAVDCLTAQYSSSSPSPVSSATRSERKLPPRILCTTSMIANPHNAQHHPIPRRVSFINLPPEDSTSGKDSNTENNNKQDATSGSSSSDDDDDGEEDVPVMYNSILSAQRKSNANTSPSNGVPNRTKTTTSSSPPSSSSSGNRSEYNKSSSSSNSRNNNNGAAPSSTNNPARTRLVLDLATLTESAQAKSATSPPLHRSNSSSANNGHAQRASPTLHDTRNGNASKVIVTPQRSILTSPPLSQKAVSSPPSASASASASSSSSTAALLKPSTTSITAPSSTPHAEAVVVVHSSAAHEDAKPPVHYMYGDNAENFDRDVIGKGGQVIVFTASMTGQRNTRDHFRSLENLLQAKQVTYHIMDVADNAFLQRTAREIYQRGTGVEGKGKPLPLPLLTVDRALVGDYTAVQDMEDEGILMEQLVKLGYRDVDLSVILPQSELGRDASLLSEPAQRAAAGNHSSVPSHNDHVSVSRGESGARDYQTDGGRVVVGTNGYDNGNDANGNSDYAPSFDPANDNTGASWGSQTQASGAGGSAVHANSSYHAANTHAPSRGGDVTENYDVALKRLSCSQPLRASRNVNYTHHAENVAENESDMSGSSSDCFSFNRDGSIFAINNDSSSSTSIIHPSKADISSSEAASSSSSAPRSILVKGSAGLSMRNINYQDMPDGNGSAAYTDKATHRLSDTYTVPEERGRRSSFVKFT